MLDVLDGVPAIDRMLVMVQREVGERLAGGAGDVGVRHPVGEGGVLGHRRGRRAGRPERVPAPAEGGVGARPDRPSPAPGDAGGPRPAVRPRAGRLRAAPQDAAPLTRPAWSTVDDFGRAGVAPEARAEQLSVEQWGRLAGAPE